MYSVFHILTASFVMDFDHDACPTSTNGYIDTQFLLFIRLCSCFPNRYYNFRVLNLNMYILLKMRGDLLDITKTQGGLYCNYR